jgi:hypothetical protein
MRKIFGAFVLALAVAAIGVSAQDGANGGPGEDQVGAAGPGGKGKLGPWAVVNANGTEARGEQILSTANVGLGAYEVITTKNVSLCAFVAVIGSSASSGTEPTGQITTVRRVGTTNGIFIATTDSAGNPANRGFHLMTVC